LFRSFCCILWSIVVASPVLAQLPAARTSAIFPPGGSVGSSFDVAVYGDDLDDAKELRFSHPGISAKKSEPAKADKAGAAFAVTIAGDVPIGTYDCRIVGRFGISNPRAFMVHDRAVTTAKIAGNAPDSAAELPLNSYAAGRCDANSYDFWTFRASKGQRLMVECLAAEIDSKLSPNLAIDDPTGRELHRSRRVGFIDFTAPQEGIYNLRVSDMLYRGGAEFGYFICVGEAPRLNHIFPPSAKPGTRGRFTVYGRNLPNGMPSTLLAGDGKPLEQLELEIDVPTQPAAGQELGAAGLTSPSTVPLDGFAFRIKSSYGSSNAVPILFMDGASALEQESVESGSGRRNDIPSDAQKLQLPAEVAGRFYPRNDRDYYTFEARKGDVYYIEIVCHRLDLPAAPLVVVQRADTDKAGEKIVDVLTSPEDDSNLGTPGFRTATRDFAMRWEVKEDGPYRLLVRDRFSVARDDGSLRYHLSIRKPSPDFQLAAAPVSVAPSETAVWNPLLRQGGSTPLRVSLFRRDGFDADVTVSVKGLPPGVSCDPITLTGSDEGGVLMLTADAKADSWSGPIGVIATAKVEGKDVSRQARAGAIVAGSAADGRTNRNNEVDPVLARLVNELAIGVCQEQEPVTIAAAIGDKIPEVVLGEKVTIPLKVSAATDLKAALKLKAAGLDAVRNVREITVEAGKSAKASLELDTRQSKLSPATHVFYLASPATVKYARPIAKSDGESGKGDGAKGDASKGKNDSGKKPDAKDVTTLAVSGPIVVKVLPAPAGKK